MDGLMEHWQVTFFFFSFLTKFHSTNSIFGGRMKKVLVMIYSGKPTRSLKKITQSLRRVDSMPHVSLR